jgi:hypothetical protein
MNCPCCKVPSIERDSLFVCDTEDHEFTFVKSSGSWWFNMIKPNYQIGRDINSDYYVGIKHNIFNISKINVQDCVDYLNRFLKLKSFL